MLCWGVHITGSHGYRIRSYTHCTGHVAAVILISIFWRGGRLGVGPGWPGQRWLGQASKPGPRGIRLRSFVSDSRSKASSPCTGHGERALAATSRPSAMLLSEPPRLSLHPPPPHFPIAKCHTQTLLVQDLSPHCYQEPRSVTLSPATTPAPRGPPPPPAAGPCLSSQRCWAPHYMCMRCWSMECVRSPHSTQLGPVSLQATCFLEPFYPPPAIGGSSSLPASCVWTRSLHPLSASHHCAALGDFTTPIPLPRASGLLPTLHGPSPSLRSGP